MVNSDLLPDDACDSDGEVVGQESSIFAVLEFISVLGESENFQTLLLPIFPQLLYLLIIYVQITQEQVLSGMLANTIMNTIFPGWSLDARCESVCR